MAKKIPTETVKAKDLRVGDIVLIDRFNEQHRTGVVTQVSIVPKAERPVTQYNKDYYVKMAMRRVLVTLPDGGTQFIGHAVGKSSAQMEPTAWIERQCPREQEKAKEAADEVLRYRVGVRTVVSRLETELQSWKSQGRVTKRLDPFFDRLTRVLSDLEQVDVDMTLLAGRDPEKDKRKPVHPYGRRRN